MKKRILALCAVFVLLISTAAYANSTSVAVKVSTLGLGGEVEISLTDSIGIRAGLNYYTYSFSGIEGGINYEFDLNLNSVPILVDWHPFKGSFRLSGGVMYNGNNFDASATNLGIINIGGVDFDSTEISTLSAEIEFSSFAPYAGFGWDTTFGDEGGLGFSFEAGALFQGSPEASLSATGTFAGIIATELAAEEQELQDALDSFTIFPVVSFGINYRF